MNSRQLVEVALGRRDVIGDEQTVAHQLGVQGLSVLALKTGRLTDGMRRRLLRDRSRLAAMHALRLRALDVVREEAERLDCPVAVTKGFAYALELYDEPEERPMVDVDVLVPDGRHHDMATALLARGFRDADPERLGKPRERKMAQGPVLIEVQDAVGGDRRFRFPPDLLLARSRPLPDLPGFATLSEADALGYHAAHQAMHGYRLPLVGYFDLMHLMRRTRDVDAAVERARVSGALGALRTSLSIAQSLGLDVDVPASLQAQRAEVWLARMLVPPNGAPPERHASLPLPYHLALRVVLSDGPATTMGAIANGVKRLMERAEGRP